MDEDGDLLVQRRDQYLTIGAQIIDFNTSTLIVGIAGSFCVFNRLVRRGVACDLTMNTSDKIASSYMQPSLRAERTCT